MLGIRQTFIRRAEGSKRGFTLIELVVAMSVAVILTAISVPLVSRTVALYRLRGASSVISGAIQTTRHQAIYLGYPLQLTISKDNHNYQLAGKDLGAGATTFTNIGATVPWNTAVSADQNMVIQFSPGGSVVIATGTLPLVMSFNSKTETIRVSGYGNVTVVEQ